MHKYARDSYMMQTRLTWWNYRCQKFYSQLLATHDWCVLTLPLTKGGPKTMARDTLDAHAKPYGPPRSLLAPPKGTLSNPKRHHRGERAPFATSYGGHVALLLYFRQVMQFLKRTCGAFRWGLHQVKQGSSFVSPQKGHMATSCRQSCP
jgi:hypothetical protein